MNEREKFERILASVHEAALDDARWPSASALIDDALGVHGNCLAFADLNSSKELQFLFVGIFFRGQRHHELEREYIEDYYSLDERVPRFGQVPDSKLYHITDLFTEEELKNSALYNDFSNRMHAQNSINLRLDGPGGLSFCWGINDPVDGNGWSSARLDSIRRLLPHIRQYMRVRQALGSAGALGSSLTEMLDTTGAGFIHLDRHGRIVEMNDRARDFLRTGDGLFDESGFLFARAPQDNAKLQGVLNRALPPFGTQGVGGSTVVRRASALPLAVHVNPVDRQETDYGIWPVAALVLVVDPASRHRINPVTAGAVLGLTKMESQVAVLLAEGRSVAQIAAAFGRKESTIRTHVKQMFSKLGLSRQVDLVRLVLSLPGAQRVSRLKADVTPGYR